MKNLLKKIATAQHSDINLDRQFNECNRGTAMKLHHSIILISAVALCLPLSANAGEAKRPNGGSIVEYNDNGAFDNSANDVTVGFDSNRHFIVEDAKDLVSFGSGCSRINDHTADCGRGNVAKVKMDLGGGRDVVVPRSASSLVKLEINGGEGGDRLQGGAGRDVLNGGGGDDIISGGGGDDTINGDFGNDSLRGNTGIDTIDGGFGNDDIRGGDGDDILKGGLDNDTITGELGKDKMFGNQGDDKLKADDNFKDTVDCGSNFPSLLPEKDQADIDSGLRDTVSNCESTS